MVGDSTFVGTERGISAINTEILVIQDCEFLYTEVYGINLFHFTTEAVAQTSAVALIQYCRFVSGKLGIATVNAQNAFILKCEFQNIEQAITVTSQPRVLRYIQPPYYGNIWIQKCTVIGGIFGVKIQGLLSTNQQLQLYGSVIQNTNRVNVSIQNTTISNTSSGIYLYSVDNGIIAKCAINNNLNYGVLSLNSHSTIHKTNFTENNIGLVAASNKILLETLLINKCVFSRNAVVGMLLVGLSTLPTGMIVTNCSFYENQGTPITAHHSDFELRGENIFKDNTAERGGGIALYVSSKVIFDTGSNTTFISNNVAEFGGAIYIASQFELLLSRAIKLTLGELLADIEMCFYHMINDTETSINFISNSALLSRLDIYGAIPYTEDCNFLSNQAFKFYRDNASSTFKISSNPTRVCFCVDQISRCENKGYIMLNETRYPGETFTASVSLAGYNFGKVAGSVYTNVLGRDYEGLIKESQHVQTIDVIDCGTLTYSVLSNKIDNSVVLVLTTLEQLTQERDDSDIQENFKDIYSEKCSDNTCAAFLYTPIYINVTLEPCPLGFKLDSIDRICKCERNINSTNSTCEILDHTGYITRQGTVWIGVDTSDNDTSMYYWHRYCQRDYCIPSQTSIDLRYPDKQCSSNRSGILCGKC